MGNHVGGSLKEGVSSGEDGPWNQGQVLQRRAQEEPLEQGRIRTVVDNDYVAVLDKNTQAAAKSAATLSGKGSQKKSFRSEDPGGGNTWRTKGALAGGGNASPPT